LTSVLPLGEAVSCPLRAVGAPHHARSARKRPDL